MKNDLEKYRFLKSRNLKYLELDTFILCNPNAMSYQNMINYPQAYYLKYFLSKQMNVLVWNYRAYGRTDGTPDPDHLQYEIEQVFHFLKYRIGVKGKIGIYGRSLGCVAACRLTPYVDMIIADRGFSNLHVIASKKFHGKIADLLFQFITQGWQVNNSFNFLLSSI